MGCRNSKKKQEIMPTTSWQDDATAPAPVPEPEPVKVPVPEPVPRLSEFSDMDSNDKVVAETPAEEDDEINILPITTENVVDEPLPSVPSGEDADADADNENAVDEPLPPLPSDTDDKNE